MDDSVLLVLFQILLSNSKATVWFLIEIVVADRDGDLVLFGAAGTRALAEC